MGRPQQAAAELDALTRLRPRGPAEQLSIANMRLLLNQCPQAEAMYRAVIRQQPRNDQAWQGLAAALSEERRYFEARQAALRAVQLRPGDPGAQYLLASATLQDAQQFSNNAAEHQELAQARSAFRRLAATLPDNAEVYVHLGTACTMLQDWGGAFDALRRALALAPRPEIYGLLAAAERGASDTAAAQDIVAQGLDRYPKDAALHDLRGQLLQSAPGPGAAAQALTEFETAVALQPKDETYLEHEGTALVQAGRFAEARSVFEAAAGLAPDRAFSYQQLAVVYTRLGDVPKARLADKVASSLTFNAQQLEQIELLSAVHPDNISLILVLADRYRTLGRTGAARDEYLRALRLDPANARARKGIAALGGVPRQ